MKIALAMIVKGTEEEAGLLDRCLESIAPHVDQVFITITHTKGVDTIKDAGYQACRNIARKYQAYNKPFEWIKDFSAARNESFKFVSEVTKDRTIVSDGVETPVAPFDYILWCDSDDIWQGGEKIKLLLEASPDIDAWVFNYLYEFDKYGKPVVVHKKTQIVRNDGCVEWKGAIHEDLIETRSLSVKVNEEIFRMHMTTEERSIESNKRNVEISEKEAKDNPRDPRTSWNLANSYIGAGMYTEARKLYMKFIKESGSDQEIYIARMRLSGIHNQLGEKEEAIQQLQMCIGMSPEMPDAYLNLGKLYFEYQRFEKAEFYLLIGLKMKPRYEEAIVWNPRDYDYNPLMLLAKTYFNQFKPHLALPALEACLKIYPDHEEVKNWIRDMKVEVDKMKGAVEVIKSLADETDKERIKKAIEALPKEVRSHPAVCALWNKTFIKETSSGKDLVYYCGMTEHEWNPEMAKTKGIGGSEEAVINLSKQWVAMGWNVTVYNNCGTQEMICDGVTYKPFWEYNYRDKQDVIIVWRHPKLLDYDINCENLYIDLHDVVPKGEFNEKRLAKLKKIFVKTNAHRVLFPNIPDEKIEIIPNGQDFSLFNQEVKKDQYLMVNTSSPDRSMDVLPRLFKKVKERVPQARLKWAYGFDIFDQSNHDNKEMMEWKDKVVKEMEEAGVENLGRLSQKECAKLYLEGNVLAYPSEFYEIDCITVKKAQACGCVPVTTNFAAFDESVQYGVKIHSTKNKETWSPPYKASFGLEDEKAQNEWVDAVVKKLQEPIEDRTAMMEWSKKFDWKTISEQWNKILS